MQWQLWGGPFGAHVDFGPHTSCVCMVWRACGIGVCAGWVALRCITHTLWLQQVMVSMVLAGDFQHTLAIQSELANQKEWLATTDMAAHVEGRHEPFLGNYSRMVCLAYASHVLGHIWGNGWTTCGTAW